MDEPGQGRVYRGADRLAFLRSLSRRRAGQEQAAHLVPLADPGRRHVPAPSPDFCLAAGTAWVYPVQTGDKPIIALYPTGIVTYEMTMLFALVGTMVGMFLEMRLPALKKRLYDPAISRGLHWNLRRDPCRRGDCTLRAG